MGSWFYMVHFIECGSRLCIYIVHLRAQAQWAWHVWMWLSALYIYSPFERSSSMSLTCVNVALGFIGFIWFNVALSFLEHFIECDSRLYSAFHWTWLSALLFIVHLKSQLIYIKWTIMPKATFSKWADLWKCGSRLYIVHFIECDSRLYSAFHWLWLSALHSAFHWMWLSAL